ncbi:unnamed protein product, partial [Closterium sp. Yama58-4]
AQAGNYEAAVEAFAQLEEQGEEESAGLLAWRGAANALTGRHTQAIADLTKALKLISSDLPIYQSLLQHRAVSHLKLQQFREAIADWTTMIDADPSNVAAIRER